MSGALTSSVLAVTFVADTLGREIASQTQDQIMKWAGPGVPSGARGESGVRIYKIIFITLSTQCCALDRGYLVAWHRAPLGVESEGNENDELGRARRAVGAEG